MEKARKADDAQQLEQILRDKNVINYIDCDAYYWLASENVADAYSLYCSMQAANDDISDFTKTQALAVKQRIKRIAQKIHKLY